MQERFGFPVATPVTGSKKKKKKKKKKTRRVPNWKKGMESQ